MTEPTLSMPDLYMPMLAHPDAQTPTARPDVLAEQYRVSRYYDTEKTIEW